MLHLQNHSHSILKNISLRIDNHLIILGDNGAGKSTLAKVLCGIIKSQSVSIDTTPLHRLSLRQRAVLVNYIPTKLEIFDRHITMGEYLALSNVRGMDTKPIVQKLGIEHLLPKTQISSGEESLVLMASALICGAKYTIFDEPTANLDPKRSVEMFKILQNDTLIEHKIIITHDINLAHKLGYDILYLQDGQIIFHGTNEAFFEEQNLENIFGDAIVGQEGFYRVNL
ncbi:MAG: ATP-binding cassette domain-containing protein [Campylobacterales bacterium]|nr:ATP-binding cassette domain-containing protein [Campylobacterales bacterium]